MISSYCEYISRYLRRFRGQENPIPGEHHFVAAYLVPKLYGIHPVVPCYINPDGTKKIRGDVAYFTDGIHSFGIEVKLGKMHFTKGEFNSWVVPVNPDNCPEMFVGVGTEGLVLAPWAVFRKAYIALIRTRNPEWVPSEISKNYGPIRDVDQLLPHLKEEDKFLWSSNEAEWPLLETKATSAFKSALEANHSLQARRP